MEFFFISVEYSVFSHNIKRKVWRCCTLSFSWLYFCDAKIQYITMCACYMLTLSPVLPSTALKQDISQGWVNHLCSTDSVRASVCVRVLSVGLGCCSQHTYVIFWRPWSWCCPSPWHITSITQWCTIWSEGSQSSNSTSSTTCWRYYFMIHKVMD